MKNGKTNSSQSMKLPAPQPLPIPEISPKRAVRRKEPTHIAAASLDALRTEISKVSGGKKLQLILDSPAPGALIRRMPPQELLVVLKDIGKDDCAEIVELATTEQIAVCLDLDCWSKDKFQIEQLDTWLAYLAAAEFGAAERILQSLDVELLVRYCMDLFNIYYREEEDWPAESPGDLIQMPDLFYVIEIPYPADDPRSTLAHGMVQLFYQYGYDFYHRLFEWIRWGQRTELEEEAYQFRKSRVEDYGFLDYYDAISIYQPLPSIQHAPKIEPVEVPPEEVLPILVPNRMEGLFGQAFAALENPELQARVQRELLFLTNKVLCADLVDPGHEQGIQQTTRAIFRTLELGLETLAGRDVHEAALELAEHGVEWLFRVGFTSMTRLRQKAQSIAKDKRLTLVEKHPLSLLPTPFIDVMNAVRHLKPRYHTALDTPPGNIPRPFRKHEEIDKVQQALETTALLAPLFFDEFGFSHDQLVEWVQSDILASPLHPEDIHLPHLFLTALAHFTLSGEFVLRPLQPQQVMAFLNQIFQPQDTPPHLIDEAFQARVESELLRRPNTTAAETAGLQQFLRGTWQTLCEQAAHLPLPLTKPPQPEFLSLFLIAK